MDRDRSGHDGLPWTTSVDARPSTREWVRRWKRPNRGAATLARAEDRALGEAGLQRGLGPPFMTARHDIRVQQVVEAIELHSIEDVHAEIITGDFCTEERERHATIAQSCSNPVAPRSGQHNMD